VRAAPDGSLRVGRIVEVEAYGGPLDRASHARAGRTARTAIMFGPPGRAYVYLVYGMYDCLNVVTGEDGAASAVLLRAVEPLAGLEAMAAARSQASARRKRPGTAPTLDAIASGPGRLCAAFGVDRSFTGVDLCDPASGLRIERALPGDRPPEPAWTPRVGVAYAGEPWASLAWRLIDRSSPALSTAVPGTVRPDPDPQPAGLEPSA
jgi:DNA-3-methyladenine glycosylase